MKDELSLIDYHAAHAPPRPPRWFAWPEPKFPKDLPDKEATEQHAAALRRWQVEMEVAWRLNYAMEIVNARGPVIQMATKFQQMVSEDS